MATPVIEIDYPPEEESGMLFDGGATATAADKRQKKQPGLIGASSYFADLNCTADPDNYESADLEDDVSCTLFQIKLNFVFAKNLRFFICNVFCKFFIPSPS